MRHFHLVSCSTQRFGLQVANFTIPPICYHAQSLPALDLFTGHFHERRASYREHAHIHARPRCDRRARETVDADGVDPNGSCRGTSTNKAENDHRQGTKREQAAQQSCSAVQASGLSITSIASPVSLSDAENKNSREKVERRVGLELSGSLPCRQNHHHLVIFVFLLSFAAFPGFRHSMISIRVFANSTRAGGRKEKC